MDLDPLFLSRLQFAWVVAWHILMPAFTVGLASYIAVLEGLHLATARAVYLRLSNFWIRIFAVSFGMGVVSGVVMPFQFRSNFGVLSFISTTTIFGTPVDVTLQELAMETFFPADARTGEALRQLATRGTMDAGSGLPRT